MATDSFTGSGALTGNWTEVTGTFNQTGGAVYGNSAGSAYAVWTGSSFSDDQEVETTIAPLGGGQYIGGALRCSAGAFTCVQVQISSADLYLYKWAAGTPTTIAGPLTAPSSGDVVKIRMVGDTLTYYFNGSLQGTYGSVGAPASGSIGLVSFGTGTTTGVSDWTGTSLSPPPSTTIVTGSATAAVGIPEPYLYKLDADPGASTVNVTPTAPVAGSFSASPLALTTANWNTGLSSSLTASAAGSGNISSTNDGGLTNDTLAVTVHPVSRPSAVTPNTWTDEAGGSLVVADINDASDSTGAKDPAGASYPVLAFTMDTPMAASVAQTCYFRGRDITAGKQARQVLFATDGTTVVATGAWHTMTGSLATYSDVLTPTATAYKGEIQTQEYIPIFGVIWPSNPDTNSDVRLNWTGAASVSRTAQTIIWKSNYEQQDGYYAVWWRLPDAAPTFVASEWHFGTHPWPGSTSVNSAGQATGGTGGTGTVHQFEIATIGSTVDYITSPSAANGGPFTVTKSVWQTEAATVEVISGTTLRHTYWPDISNPTSYIQQDRVLASLDTPTAERVVFGGSPWTADNPTSGKNSESASGTFRYWKIFSAALSITDIATEAASESDSAVTTAGIASAFYSNINPTPTDVTDKSGNGHDPVWANANRPTLYTG